MRCYKLLLLVLMPAVFFSQNSLRLLSENGTVFQVFMNDKSVNAKNEAEVLISGIKKDTLKLVVKFENGGKFPVLVFLLDKGRAVTGKEFNYLIEPDQQKIRVRFSGMYDVSILPVPLVPKKPVIDSSLAYRNKKFGHLCELKEGNAAYFNNVPKDGPCRIAMPPEYLSYTRQLMEKAEVPDDKYRIVENICRNNCLSCEQLNSLLTYIDYEIEKLKMIRIAFVHLTDVANKKTLEKSFRFESSVKELNTFLATANQDQTRTSQNCLSASPQADIEKLTGAMATSNNDALRLETLKKTFSEHCYSAAQVTSLLKLFIHDREKLEAAKLLYHHCSEKHKYKEISEAFSYKLSESELLDFIEKQKK